MTTTRRLLLTGGTCAALGLSVGRDLLAEVGHRRRGQTGQRSTEQGTQDQELVEVGDEGGGERDDGRERQ